MSSSTRKRLEKLEANKPQEDYDLKIQISLSDDGDDETSSRFFVIRDGQETEITEAQYHRLDKKPRPGDTIRIYFDDDEPSTRQGWPPIGDVRSDFPGWHR